MPNRDLQSLEDMSVITHGYDEVDDDELWQVIQRDLPELAPRLEAILASLTDSAPPPGSGATAGS